MAFWHEVSSKLEAIADVLAALAQLSRLVFGGFLILKF